MVDTFGTGKISDQVLGEWIAAHTDLRPRAIIDTLNLRKVSYETTAAYGHFGKSWLPWEQLDMELIHSLRNLM